VNFFAHVSIATIFTRSDAVGFGAMLPDFVSLLGIRAPRPRHPEIATGYALHQATDAAFHALPTFREACRTHTLHLRRVGFDRGPSTAMAHVGLEFLLDDALSADEPSQSLFRSSLLSATPKMLASDLAWNAAEDAARFEVLRGKLLEVDQPRMGLDPERIATRIFRTLDARPRLAIRSEQIPAVTQWIAALQAEPEQIFRALIHETLTELDRALPRRRRRSAESLRFRRAHDLKL
jgi:hypothetical protein